LPEADTFLLASRDHRLLSRLVGSGASHKRRYALGRTVGSASAGCQPLGTGSSHDADATRDRTWQRRCVPVIDRSVKTLARRKTAEYGARPCRASPSERPRDKRATGARSCRADRTTPYSDRRGAGESRHPNQLASTRRRSSYEPSLRRFAAIESPARVKGEELLSLCDFLVNDVELRRDDADQYRDQEGKLASGIDVLRWISPHVGIAILAIRSRRLAQVGVLCREAASTWIQMPRPGVVQADFFVKAVGGVANSVLARAESFLIAQVPPCVPKVSRDDVSTFVGQSDDRPQGIVVEVSSPLADSVDANDAVGGPVIPRDLSAALVVFGKKTQAVVDVVLDPELTDLSD
jgi:hypothetical protein